LRHCTLTVALVTAVTSLFPSPAILPEMVTALVVTLAVGPVMKCGLAASAAAGQSNTASANAMAKRRRMEKLPVLGLPTPGTARRSRLLV
jgi:hypothetical protein